RSIERLQGRWPNLILVHLPVHTSWLNQVEIYHSIIQRKVLDPNDFESTAEIARTLNEFERRYNEIAQPFAWDFSRQDLAELIDRLDDHDGQPRLPLAA
ncbi:MAG: IS630 family transposase, partial [Gemmatimonadales bacterium]